MRPPLSLTLTAAWLQASRQETVPTAEVVLCVTLGELPEGRLPIRIRPGAANHLRIMPDSPWPSDVRPGACQASRVLRTLINGRVYVANVLKSFCRTIDQALLMLILLHRGFQACALQEATVLIVWSDQHLFTKPIHKPRNVSLAASC